MVLERSGLTSIEHRIYSLTNEDILIVDDNFVASTASIGKILGVAESISAS